MLKFPKLIIRIVQSSYARHRGLEWGYGLELRLDSTVLNIGTPTTHFNDSSWLKDVKPNPS